MAENVFISVSMPKAKATGYKVLLMYLLNYMFFEIQCHVISK